MLLRFNMRTSRSARLTSSVLTAAMAVSVRRTLALCTLLSALLHTTAEKRAPGELQCTSTRLPVTSHGGSAVARVGGLHAE
jgi:hypothetical protein